MGPPHSLGPEAESAAGRLPPNGTSIFRFWRKVLPSSFFQLCFAFVRPLRLAVCQKLLKHRKSYFAVIQGVPEIATFVNPCGWDPRQRQAEELFDFGVTSSRAGIGRDGDIRLIRHSKFLQHGVTVVAIVPNRNKNEFRISICLDHFCPATAL